MTIQELQSQEDKVKAAQAIRGEIEALNRILEKIDSNSFAQTAAALGKEWPAGHRLYSASAFQATLQRWLAQSAKADIEKLQKAFSEL